MLCKRFEPSGQRPNLHHIAEGSGIRSTFAMAPLCHMHHQGALGIHGMGSDAFILMFRPPGDSEYGLLVWLLEDLAEFLKSRVPFLGKREING